MDPAYRPAQWPAVTCRMGGSEQAGNLSLRGRLGGKLVSPWRLVLRQVLGKKVLVRIVPEKDVIETAAPLTTETLDFLDGEDFFTIGSELRPGKLPAQIQHGRDDCAVAF